MEGFENLQDFEGGGGVQVAGRILSANSTVGRLTTARAMARRCCSPPERAMGSLFRASRPTLSRAAWAHALAAGRPTICRGQQHVVEDAAVEEELLVLEDQAEVAAQVRQGTLSEGGQVLAIDHEAAGGGPLDGGDEFDQGRFATANGR